ncbi:hypothetical protein AVEN_232589-1 [Araneus ventricosus]|uniref:Uncharacterized protein n=1 Tax=Araneus ventricosus TaxID=182803 RepID=A0A4Y2M7N1_ARAVE|nr:hypothetical protein AVEN_232589-1 [Araneus ventricosus]
MRVCCTLNHTYWDKRSPAAVMQVFGGRECQLRCCPRHLIAVENYVVSPKIVLRCFKMRVTQIAILVCSKFALQVCKLSANLSRQVCKCETRLQQVNASLEVTIGQACRKFALQTIAKSEYEHNPG